MMLPVGTFWDRPFVDELFWRRAVLAPGCFGARAETDKTSVCNEYETQRVGQRKTWIKV